MSFFIPTTRHIKYKLIKFVPHGKSASFKRFGTISKTDKISAYDLIARSLSCVIVQNWPKWQSLNPHHFTKKDHMQNIEVF